LHSHLLLLTSRSAEQLHPRAKVPSHYQAALLAAATQGFVPPLVSYIAETDLCPVRKSLLLIHQSPVFSRKASVFSFLGFLSPSLKGFNEHLQFCFDFTGFALT
jgi:hypothetical protein